MSPGQWRRGAWPWGGCDHYAPARQFEKTSWMKSTRPGEPTKSYWKYPIYSGLTHWKWWFWISMLVHQMVVWTQWFQHMNLSVCSLIWYWTWQTRSRLFQESHGIISFILHWQVPHALPASVVAAGAWTVRSDIVQTVEGSFEVDQSRAEELKDSERRRTKGLVTTQLFQIFHDFPLPKTT